MACGLRAEGQRGGGGGHAAAEGGSVLVCLRGSKGGAARRAGCAPSAAVGVKGGRGDEGGGGGRGCTTAGGGSGGVGCWCGSIRYSTEATTFTGNNLDCHVHSIPHVGLLVAILIFWMSVVMTILITMMLILERMNGMRKEEFGRLKDGGSD